MNETARKLAKTYQKYRLYVVPAVVIISAVILIGFVIYPQTSKLLLNLSSQKSLDERTKRLEVKAAQLQSINQEDVVRKTSIALQALPEDQGYPDVIGLIQEVVFRNGFSITSLQVGSAVTDASINVPGYNLGLELLGQGSLLNNLFENLESSGRVMKIRGIDVSGEKPGGVVTATVNLDVYFAPLAASSLGADEPLPQLSSEEEQVLARLSQVIQVSTVPVLPSQPSLSIPTGKSNPFE